MTDTTIAKSVLLRWYNPATGRGEVEYLDGTHVIKQINAALVSGLSIDTGVHDTKLTATITNGAITALSAV
jgi:hypothetical protein